MCAISEYGSLKPENFAGAKDMDTAIFQAGKAKRKLKNKGRQSTSPNQQAGQDAGANTQYNPVHHQEEDEVYAPQFQQPQPPARGGRPARNDRPAAAVTTGGFDGFEEEDLADYT